jgi:hypothetical protein
MTTTQIASMNPIARTASILNSLPAENFCRGLGHFTPSRAREPSQSNPFGMDIRRNIDPARRKFLSKIDGVEHNKSNDHRCEADAEHATHVMPGHALARLLGWHHGAHVALQPGFGGYGAVLRRAHGHSPFVAPWVAALQTTNGLRTEFLKTARGRAHGPSPLSRVLRAV